MFILLRNYRVIIVHITTRRDFNWIALWFAFEASGEFLLLNCFIVELPLKAFCVGLWKSETWALTSLEKVWWMRIATLIAERRAIPAIPSELLGKKNIKTYFTIYSNASLHLVLTFSNCQLQSLNCCQRYVVCSIAQLKLLLAQIRHGLAWCTSVEQAINSAKQINKLINLYRQYRDLYRSFSGFLHVFSISTNNVD